MCALSWLITKISFITLLINFVEQSISKIRFINFKQNTYSLMRFEVQGDEDSYCRILDYDTV